MTPTAEFGVSGRLPVIHRGTCNRLPGNATLGGNDPSWPSEWWFMDGDLISPPGRRGRLGLPVELAGTVTFFVIAITSTGTAEERHTL